jgi:hypothetical protein
MNNVSVGWRQARIFTSDFSHQWYFGLLANFAIPFAKQYPETPFWFTRYTIRHSTGEDNGDTYITELPARFLQPQTNTHFSIRFRFCPAADEEAFLESLFPDPQTGTHWHSHFLSYDALGEFAGVRFCSSPDIARRLRRTNLLVRLLHANCVFVLDAIQLDGGAWRFEPNNEFTNRFSTNPFQSVIHLLSQITGPNGHEPLPLFWRDAANGNYITVASC